MRPGGCGELCACRAAIRVRSSHGSCRRPFMSNFCSTTTRATLAAAVLVALGPITTAAQEVELVVVDPNAVAKGYSANELIDETVMNERREQIGTIDDLVITRADDDSEAYAVLKVGDFVGFGGHLVAVPFTSLEVDEQNDRIVLAGATREALKKLPVYQGAS
jgi:sporulation protein YlmC with PRC-barrel domain